MIAVLHQVFFMTYVGAGSQQQEIDINDYRITNFEFPAGSYSPEEYVIFNFSEPQE